MYRVYLGLTTDIPAERVRELFDVFYREGADDSFFGEKFGAAYIEVGTFEAYDRTETDEGCFSFENLMFPFPITPEMFDGVDIKSAMCFFFFVNEKVFPLGEHEGVRLFRTILVKSYY